MTRSRVGTLSALTTVITGVKGERYHLQTGHVRATRARSGLMQKRMAQASPSPAQLAGVVNE